MMFEKLKKNRGFSHPFPNLTARPDPHHVKGGEEEERESRINPPVSFLPFFSFIIICVQQNMGCQEKNKKKRGNKKSHA